MNERPSDELLAAYLDGNLSPEERAQVEASFATDSNWKKHLEELRSIRSTLQSLPRFELDKDFHRRVLEAAMRAEDQENSTIPDSTSSLSSSPRISPTQEPFAGPANSSHLQSISVSTGRRSIQRRKMPLSGVLVNTALAIAALVILVIAVQVVLSRHSVPLSDNLAIATREQRDDAQTAPQQGDTTELKDSRSEKSNPKKQSFDGTSRPAPLPATETPNEPLTSVPQQAQANTTTSGIFQVPAQIPSAKDNSTVDPPASTPVENSPELDPQQLEQRVRTVQTEIHGEILIQLDSNQNQWISDQEVQHAAGVLRQAITEAQGTIQGDLFKQLLDTNQNGTVEDIEIAFDLAAKRVAAGGLGKAVSSAFEDLDANHDLFLTEQEIRTAIRKLGNRRRRIYEPRIPKLWSEIDFDKDSQLSHLEVQLRAESFARQLDIPASPLKP